MKTTEYTGPSAAIKGDCPWLASEDILGKGDIVVTIEACHAVQDAEFEGGRKEDLYTLSFVGAKKQLILNSTNRKTLVSLYGTNVGKWKGQPITLYVEEGIRCFGEIRNGLRIRKTKPNVKPKTPPETDTKSEPQKEEPSTVADILLDRLDDVTDSAQLKAIGSAIGDADLTAVELKALTERFEEVEAELSTRE
jgi:hypothetical protein